MNLWNKKLALLMGLKKKRPYYCEVEYLEATGTQYIDTEYLIGANKLEIKMRVYAPTATRENNIVSNQTNTNNTGRFVIGTEASGNVFAYSRYKSSDGNALAAYIANEINDINVVFDTTNNTKTLTVNSVSDTINKCTNVSNNISKVRFFNGIASSSSTGDFHFIGKLYYAQLIKNNELWMDLIPVLDWSMKPAMYDKVSGKLYYNLGSGDDFSYGREIHEVEYLESTGTQYINTGIKPSANMRTKIKGAWMRFDSSSTKNRLFGSKTDGVNDRYFILASSTVFSFGYGDAHDVSFSTQLNTFYTCDFNYIENGSHKFKKDNNIYTYTGTPNTTIEMVLFGTKYQDNSVTLSKIKIAYCQFIDNGTLVRDYIPAIDENGVGFMFDRVTHTIFDNAGTGTFKYPVRQLEYLESDGNQYIASGVNQKNTTSNLTIITNAKFENTTTETDIIGSGSGYTPTAGANQGQYFMYARYSSSGGETDSNYHEILYSFGNPNGRLCTVDNVAVINATTNNTFSGGAYDELYVFCSSPNRFPFKGEVKNLIIIQDGALLRNFIPVYKDGVAGLWDKANNVFYENQGTGAFTVGKIIEPEYE